MPDANLRPDVYLFLSVPEHALQAANQAFAGVVQCDYEVLLFHGSRVAGYFSRTSLVYIAGFGESYRLYPADRSWQVLVRLARNKGRLTVHGSLNLAAFLTSDCVSRSHIEGRDLR